MTIIDFCSDSAHFCLGWWGGGGINHISKTSFVCYIENKWRFRRFTVNLCDVHVGLLESQENLSRKIRLKNLYEL